MGACENRGLYILTYIRNICNMASHKNGGDGGTWTHTMLPSTDFKSVASAYSATSPKTWRFLSDLNRWSQSCSLLPYHLAKEPLSLCLFIITNQPLKCNNKKENLSIKKEARRPPKSSTEPSPMSRNRTIFSSYFHCIWTLHPTDCLYEECKNHNLHNPHPLR